MTAQQQAKQQTESQGGRGAAVSRTIAGERGGGVSRARADSPPWSSNSEALCKIVVGRLLGKRHWAVKWALELCAVDSRFTHHLIDQPRDYAHYLCVLRLALADAGDQDARETARMIRSTTKKKLLKAWRPSCPADIVNVLPKLPARPMTQKAYRRLLLALEDESTRKRMRHAKRLTKFDINMPGMVDDLPEVFRLGAARHIRDMDDYFMLAAMIQVAQKLQLNITEREFSEVARKADGVHKLRNWLKKKVAKLPFPPPPWEGNDEIHPLRSRDELKQAAKDFSNCAKRYAYKIALGYSHLYVCERGPAMVEIVSDAFFGWVVEDIKGKKNRGVAGDKKHAIAREFNRAGIGLPLDSGLGW